MHGRANKCYGPLLRSATQSPGGGSSRPRELIPQLQNYTKQMFQRRIIHFLSHKEITNICSTLYNNKMGTRPAANVNVIQIIVLSLYLLCACITEQT